MLLDGMEGSIPLNLVLFLRIRTRRLQFLCLGVSAVLGAIVSLVGTASFSTAVGVGVLGAGALEVRFRHLSRAGRLARGRVHGQPTSAFERGHVLERILPTYRTDVDYAEGTNRKRTVSYLFRDEGPVLDGDDVLVVVGSSQATWLPPMLVTQPVSDCEASSTEAVATTPAAPVARIPTAPRTPETAAKPAEPTAPATPPDRCATCGERLLLGDRHCGACGNSVPSSQRQAIAAHVAAQRLRRLQTNRTLNRTMNRASGVIGVLSLLFFVSAIGMSIRGRNQTRGVREMLAAAPQDRMLTVAGEQMTVAQAQEKVRQVPIKLFVVNLVLAGIMLALFFWARVSPLPAILVAATVFVMVQILNVALAPESLGEGIVMKVFALLALATGIRAALQHRGQGGPAGHL